MNTKYAYNPTTGTIHIIGLCRETSVSTPLHFIKYKNMDDVITEQKDYAKKCKLCFKNLKKSNTKETRYEYCRRNIKI